MAGSPVLGVSAAARSLCARAVDLARASGGTAYALLGERTDLPDAPLDRHAALAGTERRLMWWGEAWLLGAGTAFDGRASGPGRGYASATAAARLRARSVCEGAALEAPLLTAFAFEDRPPGPGAWGPALPGARLILPRRTWWRRRSGEGVVIHALAVEAGDDPAAVAERLVEEPVPPADRAAPAAWPAPPERPYADLVAEAVALIEHGGLRKVVLARAVDHELPSPRAGADLLERLHHAGDANTYVYGVDLDDGALFAGATPELLFHGRNRSYTAVALAGSRPRGATSEEDHRYGAELLSSTKERKEHQLVVEHLVRRLRGRSRELDVPGVPSLRRLERLQHLETVLSGILEAPEPFDLLTALHPTPAVAGLPAEAAVDWIARHEGFQRGLYGGALGYVTPSAARAVIPLRGGIVRDRQARLFAGAGIVETSDPAAEERETELKLEPMRRALGIA